MNLATEIADLMLTRQLLLNRVVGGISNEIDRLMVDLADDIEKKIGARNLTEFQADRMKRLIRELNEYVAESYTEAESALRQQLGNIGAAEAAWVQSSINAAAGFDLLRVLPTAAAIDTVAKVDLMQGAPLSEWFKRQKSDTQFRITQAIRLGVSQGETNGQIVRRLRGLEQTDTRDNVIAASKRNLEAIVRTSVQQVANDTRTAVFDDNEEVFKYWQHRSTLDGRTSLTCVARSNLLWDYKTKQPVNHSLPFVQPPVHWSCRSVMIAIPKSFRELGIDLNEIPPSTRSSMDGQVAEDTSFDDFLKKKGTAFQDKMLGKGRADLWREGKITLTQLLDQRGNPLTVRELREQYAQ